MNPLKLTWTRVLENPKNIVDLIKNQQIGVMPTDTIYGIVGSALSQEAIEKIYQVRKRTPDKPFIVLISSLADLNTFDIKLDKKYLEILNSHWPNPISIILPVPDQKWSYLHRGTNSIAFRIPKDQKLRSFLSQTGPLTAPSANPEGYPISKNILDAQNYFKDQVSFYIDNGHLDGLPSTLVSLEKGSLKILREGVYRI